LSVFTRLFGRFSTKHPHTVAETFSLMHGRRTLHFK